MLKKYKLDNLLLLIGETSRKMLIQNSSLKKVPWIRFFGRIKQAGTMLVTSWELTDISYYAICNSNDYKSKIATEQDLLFIINNYKKYDNDLSGQKLKEVDKEDTVLFITFGLSQKQFWYQNIKEVITQFNRNVELLQIIPRYLNSTIDADRILKEELGVNAEEFNQLLLILYGIGFQQTDISKININKSITEKVPACNVENMSKIIKLYSAKYNEFRDSELKENHIFTKPIVETDSKRMIIVDHYILARLLSDGLYWAIRNYYYVRKSQEFTNEFGRFFERYLEEIFKNYLDCKKFKRLEDKGKKRKIADWILETNSYVIIIEQKSAIASLKLKTIYPDVNGIKHYLEKLSEAFEQLNETEKTFKLASSSKKVIKFIVHYELLYVQEILMEKMLKQKNKEPNSEPNTFLVSISELEVLIYLLGSNEKTFNEIMDKKLKLEYESSLNGRGFEMILKKHGLYNNDYLEKQKNHFNNMVNKYK